MRKRSEDIYNAIIKFAMAHDYLPTVREIGEITGLKSTSSVFNYMEDLELNGLIERENGGKRYRVKGLKYCFEKPITK